MHIFTKSYKVFTLAAVAAMLASFGASAQQKADSTAQKAADSVSVSKKKDNGIKASGTITDAATGKPLSGINITIPEFSAAITDEKGYFSINVPAYSATLVVSAAGYQSKEIPLKGRKSVSTSLYEESFNSVYSQAKLPFGPKANNQVPNSVTSINTQGGWDVIGSETPDAYLQGKVAGLNAIRRSGTPNIGADLFLRGYSSLNATNKPLIVVDGMIFDNSHYGTSLIQGHFNNPLANIDFNDIDNITVIKEGVSMYGTKAANGVIMITTGHTNDLATKIDFGVYSGYNFAPAPLPVMQASDYRIYLSDILQSQGLTGAQIQAQPYMNDNVNSGTYYAYHNNTDWQKQVLKNSFNQNYFLKVSGGDNVAKYTLSMGYGNDGGIVKNTANQKYNTRFNADLNLSKKFTVAANLSFTYNEQSLYDQGVAPKTNPLYVSQVKAPILRLHQVNAQGIESPNYENLDAFNISNPAILIDTAVEKSRSYRFFGNINFKYQFNKYSNLQTLIGVTYDKVRESYFIPRAGVTPDTAKNTIIYSRLGSQVERLYSIYSDTHYTYDKVFGIHHITANVGVRFTDSQTADDYALGGNSATDQFISVGTGVPALRSSGGELGAWRWLNNYVGVDYQLLNKYFLSYNMGVDASSRFGNQISGALNVNGLKLAVLPSVSAGWLVSSEPFMSDVNFVELLKLRASYGLTGNDDIGNYAARQYYIAQNLLGQEGLVRGNFGNSALQWETNKKADIGFDASLFKERLTVGFDVYQNSTSNMIINEPAPAASGLVYAVTNSGGMRTQGIELAVSGRIINQDKLKWDLGFNISKYRNKITQLPNNSMTTNYAGATILTQVGLPANLFYGYKTNGVYKSDAEALASGIKEPNALGVSLQPHGGDVRFVDVNNDGIIDTKDMQVIGNPNPDFIGAINSTLVYHRFSLNALFTFSTGNELYNYTRRVLESGSGYQNQTLQSLNRWRVDGQVTNVPKATYGDPIGNARFSDRWIEDGSYLRLRTLSLTYNVPVKVKTVKYIKIYATGNNIFTLTKYLGYDPEFSATESVFTQGIDTGLDPQFTTVQLGVRLGL